jgi:hypothetical protein
LDEIKEEVAAATPASEVSVRDAKAIMDQVVVLDLVFHRPGIYRKADVGKVETVADKTMLRLNKDIVNRKEYGEAVAVAGELRRWLLARCLPSPLRRGTYLVPISMVGDISDKIEAAEVKYLSRFEAFFQAYPKLVENAKEQLKDQFDAGNYPSVRALRSAVWVERRFLDFGVPSEAKIGKALWESEKKKAEETWTNAAYDIQEALRDAFRSLVGHLAERLEPTPDGEKKVFKDTAVEKLLEFIDLFKARNIAGDAELEGLVIRARDVLKGKKPDKLRTSSVARGEVAGEMARVQAALDKLLEKAPKRRIVFED